MVKVLLILNSDLGVPGTIGIRTLPTVKALFSRGDDFIIFCRDYKRDKFTKNLNLFKILPFGNLFMKLINGIPIYIYNKFPANSLNAVLFNYFLIRKLKKIDLENYDIFHCWDFLPDVFDYVKKRNPDIIIIKDMTMAFPNVLKPKLKTEIYWKTISSKISKLEKNSIKFIDYYILPSKITRDSLINEGILEKQIYLVPYGSNPEFKPLKNKNYNSRFKVAFAGNINHRKGVGYLIDAWKKLNLKNAELNLYGRVYPEVFSNLVDLDKFNIMINGFVDLSKELPKNHLLVHPSLLETTPKVITEALASGVPVITTYHSGPSFEDGVEGFIVDEQTSVQLAEKIKFFYDNRNELEVFSIRARESVRKFTWNDYGRYVVTIYDEIITIKK
jgi:glycosyltransferase involved in cell wall biosynthesis